MDKILLKIYSEKDLPTNIAIFIGAISFLLIYFFAKDPYLGLVAFICVFSISKTLSRLSIDSMLAQKQILETQKNYSDKEREVILTFVKNGTCFLSLSDLKQGKYEINSDIIDSLVMRDVIEFIDGSGYIGPTGFKLKEDVYLAFLKN